MKRVFLFIIISLLTIANPASADIILDQDSPYPGFPFSVFFTHVNWQQEVTVGIAGLLTGIELFARSYGTMVLYINAGSAWQSDTNDFESRVDVTKLGNLEGWSYFDVSSANLYFEQGDKFVIGLCAGDVGIGGSAIYPSPPIPLYPDRLWFEGHPWYDSYGERISFHTYVDTSSVPEPSTILLLGAGLAGVGLFRRKITK